MLGDRDRKRHVGGLVAGQEVRSGPADRRARTADGRGDASAAQRRHGAGGRAARARRDDAGRPTPDVRRLGRRGRRGHLAPGGVRRGRAAVAGGGDGRRRGVRRVGGGRPREGVARRSGGGVPPSHRVAEGEDERRARRAAPAHGRAGAGHRSWHGRHAVAPAPAAPHGRLVRAAVPRAGVAPEWPARPTAALADPAATVQWLAWGRGLRHAWLRRAHPRRDLRLYGEYVAVLRALARVASRVSAGPSGGLTVVRRAWSATAEATEPFGDGWAEQPDLATAT